jgi:hypothetical protein
MNGIYLDRGYEAPDLNLDQLREITEVGKRIEHPRYTVFFLDTHKRPDLVLCSVNRNKTRIEILEKALEPHPWSGGDYLTTDAKKAPTSEFEKVRTRSCTINWPGGSSGRLLECLRIPNAGRNLEVRGLEVAFGGPVPKLSRVFMIDDDDEFENPSSLPVSGAN